VRESNAQAILAGLSPSENRNVPPLHREWVYALARDFPHLRFSLNGQVRGDSHTHPSESYCVVYAVVNEVGREHTYCMVDTAVGQCAAQAREKPPPRESKPYAAGLRI
jgi:hypothetical protein